MVEEIKHNKETALFQCGECKLHYSEREIAERCEAWCKEHHTCHLDIIQYSVNKDDLG